MEMEVLMEKKFGHTHSVMAFANRGEVKGFKGAGVVVHVIATSDGTEANTQAARNAVDKIVNLFSTITDAETPEMQDTTKE